MDTCQKLAESINRTCLFWEYGFLLLETGLSHFLKLFLWLFMEFLLFYDTRESPMIVRYIYNFTFHLFVPCSDKIEYCLLLSSSYDIQEEHGIWEDYCQSYLRKVSANGSFFSYYWIFLLISKYSYPDEVELVSSHIFEPQSFQMVYREGSMFTLYGEVESFCFDVSRLTNILMSVYEPCLGKPMGMFGSKRLRAFWSN